jgi:hypothetical protein
MQEKNDRLLLLLCLPKLLLQPVELLIKKAERSAVSWLSPEHALLYAVAALSLVCLAILGGIAAKVGGAPVVPGAGKVMFWGALAMAVTAGVGALFGTQV